MSITPRSQSIIPQLNSSDPFSFSQEEPGTPVIQTVQKIWDWLVAGTNPGPSSKPTQLVIYPHEEPQLQTFSNPQPNQTPRISQRRLGLIGDALQIPRELARQPLSIQNPNLSPKQKTMAQECKDAKHRLERDFASHQEFLDSLLDSLSENDWKMSDLWVKTLHMPYVFNELDLEKS